MPQHGLLPESLLPDFSPAYCRISPRLIAGFLPGLLPDSRLPLDSRESLITT
jgi:hypothetical protein